MNSLDNIKSDAEIEAPEKDYLYTSISQLPNAGQGLLTAIDIYKEEVIAVFTGEIISDDEAERRMKKEEDNYFINLLDGRIMDSKHTFCFAKFANDATGNGKTPFKNNAKIALNDNDEVCLIATRKIKAGEEIFCGYGREYWKKHSEKGNH